jgi:N-acetylglucosaminyl-diphospho-decaprenol L-rhamnosyltransferase
MSSLFADVVVITYNSASCIENCLDSILKSGANAVVVDNRSTDHTSELVRSIYPHITFIANHQNRGYAAAVNQGISHTNADVVVVSNADVVYPAGSLQGLTKFVRDNPNVGAAGPQLIFPDGSWQGSYGDVHGVCEGLKRTIGLVSLHNWLRRLLWPRKLDHSPKEVGYVIGAVMAIRRTAFSSVGGWDQDFHFYAEDVDFCNRLHKAGWRVMFVPSAQVIHIAGAHSTKLDRSERFFRQLVESEVLLVRKNRAPWQVPVYKHLSRLSSIQMFLAWRLAGHIGSNSTKQYASERTLAFRHLSRIWSEECRR